ncbi:MAG: leucine-rich repeat domain-containing protein [Cytophagaceae bacterium]|nr:leucine-rich repeat domain-containing protein [Cytophagaceae bacterium]
MLKFLKTTAKLTGIFILLTSSTYNQPDAKSYYENGMTSLNKKEYIQAIGEFTNAISLNPNYADAYYYRGYAKDLLGKAMGYFSSELCFDYVTAMKLGKGDAAGKLEKTCMGECFDLDAAFLEPEVVFCADFSSKILSDLPNNTEKLHNLVKLNFFNNKLTTLSDKFGTLTNLVSLDLSSNKLTSIPPVIGKLTHLRELSLNKNQIKELPYEFGNLKEIKTLNLRQNGLTTFPKSISMLTSLENLDLALNPLTSLPLEISNLKNLKTLTLVGHEMPLKEQQKVKALLPNTTIYFE